MCHTPSSDDEPTEDLEIIYIGDSEHGFIGMIQTKFHAPEERDIPAEERQAASYRYMMERFGFTSPTEWQERVIANIIEQYRADPEAFERERLNQRTTTGGTYDAHIHRNPDGPDPLVEEPGP